jgi:hypothetical protein
MKTHGGVILWIYAHLARQERNIDIREWFRAPPVCPGEFAADEATIDAGSDNAELVPFFFLLGIA